MYQLLLYIKLFTYTTIFRSIYIDEKDEQSKDSIGKNLDCGERLIENENEEKQRDTIGADDSSRTNSTLTSVSATSNSINSTTTNPTTSSTTPSTKQTSTSDS